MRLHAKLYMSDTCKQNHFQLIAKHKYNSKAIQKYASNQVRMLIY